MANRENDEPTTQRRSINPSSSLGTFPGSATTTRIQTPIKSPGDGKGQDPANLGPTIIHGSDSEHTMIHRREIAAPNRGEASDEQYQPVTGWLVAVTGPGKGRARAVYEGTNPAGRDPSQQIPLDFGDTEISREKHFFVTYEPKKRSFHISVGEKRNLVYVNGEVVLSGTSATLSEGSEIEVGKTKLRFVPLCGPGFSWDET
jgi:hypothetical protein